MKSIDCFAYLTALCGLSSGLCAQISFSNRTDLLPSGKHFSGVAMAVVDINGDGHDDIVRLDQTYFVQMEIQNASNTPFQFTEMVELDGSQWGICIGDVDNNGLPDMLCGGEYNGVNILYNPANGAGFDFEQVQNPETFVQSLNLADIDNDGWLDAFICHDDGTPRIDTNDGAGRLGYHPNRIKLATVPPSDNSGNYGSVWSDVDNDGDLDLYIAKCRQLVNDPADGRRINQLFLNNGQGVYYQDTVNNSGLRIGAQSWTADFGDIDNDGDFDCFLTNHDVSSQLLENDGAGHFTDITAAAGLLDQIAGLAIQGIFRDFDNDGFLDILVAGTEHYLFRNNSDKTFSAVDILDNNPMESFAVGDLNTDGFLDIYAGYAELFNDPSTVPDALWMNDGNGNHYFGLNLHGVQSNRSAVGAKVRLYGPAGAQVREVRAGESYGIMNSLQVHFGLGAFSQIDSVVVYWPSGAVDRLFQPKADQYLTLWEGGCAIPRIELVASGNTVFCSGDSVTLTAPAGYTYQWNTGATSASITAGAGGSYTVTVTAPAGCTAVSNILTLVVDPMETPAITAAGDTIFCAGDSLLLTASPAKAYTWSTGDTTASIVVSKAGSYTVTTQGACMSFTSAPVQITILEPGLPSATSDTVAALMPALLAASGDSLNWYNSAGGGTALFSGPVFQTPALTQTTTYWVSNIREFDEPNQFTGMPAHIGSNFANAQTNAALLFDCFTPLRLARVKVYTNKAGDRKIDLRRADGLVLQSKTVFIPVGETVIDLNMDLPAAVNLMLTTDVSVNQQVLGTVSPQLRRSDEGVSYPYEIPGYVRIKNSSLGLERYYYFYNWEVDFYSKTCESARVPVTAVVDTTLVGVSAEPADSGIQVFPNPSPGAVRIRWEAFPGGRLDLTIFNAQGKTVIAQQQDVPAGPLDCPLDLSQCPAGFYWMRLSSLNGPVYRRICIE